MLKNSNIIFSGLIYTFFATHFTGRTGAVFPLSIAGLPADPVSFFMMMPFFSFIRRLS
jgi:hypothetical protein